MGEKEKDHKDKDKKKDKEHKDKDKKDKDKDKDHKDKKDKKDKDKNKHKDEHGKEKHKVEHGHGAPAAVGVATAALHGSHGAPAGFAAPALYGQQPFTASHVAAPGFPSAVPPPFPTPAHGALTAPSIPHAPQGHVNPAGVAPPPPSGYRVPLTTTSPFPDAAVAGPVVTYDHSGYPLFVGSALFDNSVQPCKIGSHLQPFAFVAFGGAERPHHGRFDLLPFNPQTMEWVRTSYGQVPPGRRPIEGGYEDHGAKLYHGLALVNGVKVPGKAGQHLLTSFSSKGAGDKGFLADAELHDYRECIKLAGIYKEGDNESYVWVAIDAESKMQQETWAYRVQTWHAQILLDPEAS
ncbi:hypothetical protein H0H93_009177 [Arthromyces matolae]|nr:hypothetical protein H0H93_009177 [Arthromyces matolae]